VGDMFIAGIIPGLLMAAGFIAVVSILGVVSDYPRLERKTREENIHCILAALPSLAIPAVIVGSILAGLATPTESAALAAVAAFVIGRWINRELQPGDVWIALLQAGTNTAMVLLLVAMASLFSWMLIFEQIPQRISEWIVGVTSDPFFFMLLVNAVLLVLGAVIDGIPALIMIVPVLLPIAQRVYGIDAYHFGVIVCLNLVLGLMTPPVGTGLYIAAQSAKVKAGQVFRSIIPYLLVAMLLLVLLSWQPVLITYFIQA